MLLLMLNVLCFNTSTFRSMCAVPNMAVICSSFISCFPGIIIINIIIASVSIRWNLKTACSPANMFDNTTEAISL
jgi:hypothetical protein